MAWAYSDQQHNGGLAKRAKVDVRRNVLRAMRREAHVFDAFCGPVGEMHRAVWHKATSYVGCDLEYRTTDNRKRMVGDSATVMRSIDLAPFNVFDFDAYGSPWGLMLVLEARRVWAPGEVGAVVLTDGSSTRTCFGLLSHDLATLFGRKTRSLHATGRKLADTIHDLALREWMGRQNLEPLRYWSAIGRSNAKGNQQMRNLGVVFRRRSEDVPASLDAS